MPVPSSAGTSSCSAIPAVGSTSRSRSSPSGARGVLRDSLVFLGLAPSADEEDLIKRVIGIGGDQVVCCDAQGRITVNDVALDEQDYLFPGDVPSEDTFDVTVPPGSLWLLGDHRSRSADARRHQDDERGGMVPADGVIGRAFVLVWPLDRATVFATPRTFDNSAVGHGQVGLTRRGRARPWLRPRRQPFRPPPPRRPSGMHLQPAQGATGSRARI